MTSVFQDLRYSLRMLLKHKSFTVVSVLTLALGIGINTAMFSVLNTYLFASLPYPESERLVTEWRTSQHSQSWPFSAGSFFEQHAQNTIFEKMAAYYYVSRNLTESGQTTERLVSLAATADFFPVLGVAPAQGRVFKPEEFEPGADNVIVLTDRFWTRRFGSDPTVVGRRIELDGKTVEIVGVMPPGFEHPILWGPIDIWQPLAFTPERKASPNNFLTLFGRLKPGVSIEQGEQSMVALFANIGKQDSSNEGQSVRLEPLQLSMSDSIRRNVMWFTFGLAGFVLLIACANLANLQLIRTMARARELAVRAALGADRWRLLRHSFTESILVALIGGIVSLIIALGAVRFISARLFTDLPGASVQLDYKVFGFALLVSLVTGVLFGTVPAWLASRADVNLALRDSARGSTTGKSQHRLRQMLVVGEVAFAMVLLAGAGLFLRGLQRLINADPGWQIDGMVTAQMSLRGEKYTNPKQRVVFLTELESRLRALPGVQHAAISSSYPPVFGFNRSNSFLVEGQPEPPPDKYPEMFFETVSSDYFNTLGARLQQGRTFSAGDAVDHPNVIIINEAMARTFWPNESPIGKRISDTAPQRVFYEIVGVVNDLDFPGLLGEPDTRFEAFVPMTQTPPTGLTIVLRTSSTSDAIANSLRSSIAGLAPELPVFRIRTVRAAVDQSLGSISLLGSLLGAFAAIGLVLAVIGIYGVVSYTVAQRTGELGIRMALGAQTSNVLWMVLGKGAVLVGIGAVLGVAGAYGVSKLLISLIPSLPTRDPLILAFAAVVLLAVALVACYIPARRATRVDPLLALKSD